VASISRLLKIVSLFCRRAHLFFRALLQKPHIYIGNVVYIRCAREIAGARERWYLPRSLSRYYFSRAQTVSLAHSVTSTYIIAAATHCYTLQHTATHCNTMHHSLTSTYIVSLSLSLSREVGRSTHTISLTGTHTKKIWGGYDY